MPRLFTAIEIPGDLAERLATLRAPLPGARWIQPDNLHLTLRFFGDIENRTARDLADALATIAADPFEVSITGLGTFGGHDPRAIWAAVEASPPLEALARANERAARQVGLAPESRTFRPHVTLARLHHSRADAVARYLNRNASFRADPFLVTRFVLMSSRPQVGGGPYVVEDAFAVGNFPDDFEERDAGW